jgi:hypothetical protein
LELRKRDALQLVLQLSDLAFVKSLTIFQFLLKSQNKVLIQLINFSHGIVEHTLDFHVLKKIRRKDQVKVGEKKEKKDKQINKIVSFQDTSNSCCHQSPTALTTLETSWGVSFVSREPSTVASRF